MAVQSNNPFPKLLEHNRNALFLDQEVAAFYETLSNFPDIYFLAVKGVCDYGDKSKDDDYHEYAAHVSAIYLLYFIQEYVTHITMPRREDYQSQSRAGPPFFPNFATGIPEASHSRRSSDNTPPVSSVAARNHRLLRDRSVIQKTLSSTLVLLVVAGIVLFAFSAMHSQKPQSHGTPQPGNIREFLIPTSNSFPEAITGGPDGNIWFAEKGGNRIGRITPLGQISEFPIPTQNSITSGIVLGSDGNLWFLENGSTQIGRITQQGNITEFPVKPGSNLVGIASGPDGNIWFTEFNANKIGRMNTSGVIIGEFPIPTTSSGPGAISGGPDGNV
jgi:hypothetical protein